MPSRWDSSEPNTATYRNARFGATCRTDGFNFLYQLGTDLYQRVQNAGGSLPTFDGVVSSADVPDFTPDTVTRGSWSVPLLRAMYAGALRARAPAAYLASVRADAVAGTVSRATLQTAIWLAHESHGERNGAEAFDIGSPADVELPPDAMLPVMGLSLLRPAILDITCAIGPLPVTPVTPVRTLASVLPAPGWILGAALVAGVIAVVAVSRNVPQQPHERRRR